MGNDQSRVNHDVTRNGGIYSGYKYTIKTATPSSTPLGTPSLSIPTIVIDEAQEETISRSPRIPVISASQEPPVQTAQLFSESVPQPAALRKASGFIDLSNEERSKSVPPASNKP